MVAPMPGYGWRPARQAAGQLLLGNRPHLTHTDLSGILVFEEAFYQGQQAAQAVLAGLAV